MNEYITRDEAQKLSDERLLRYCALVTVHSKEEKAYYFISFLLNITVLIALVIFFNRMYKLTKTETRKRCRNDALHTDLNNVVALFFILNILIQLISILLLSFMNYYFGYITKDCHNLLNEKNEKDIYNKKKRVFITSIIIKVGLILLVIILLSYGYYLWNQCNNNSMHVLSDVHTWYKYFSMPRKFINKDNPNDFITLTYVFTDDYYELLADKASEKELTEEFTKGYWYINDDGPFKYSGESYQNKKANIYIKNKLSNEELILTFDYHNDKNKFIIHYNGNTYGLQYKELFKKSSQK